MKRISTDAEYLDSGKIVVDADGIPVNLGYRGTGSPEGKVTAPIGSIYTDSAATNGAIRWIKASGTGSTGWRVEYGDTGMRNISASSTATDGSFVIQRVGNVVWLFASTTTFDMSDRATITTLPVGFRPHRYVYTQTPSYWATDALRTIRVVTGGDVVVRGGTDSETLNLTFPFVTNDPWPTSLPGTPA